MIGLLQRVNDARVIVSNEIVGKIQKGVLVFLGVEKGDSEKDAERLVERVLNYRIFSDDEDKMNLSVKDINGGVLVVSQFTLAADTKKGMRPSFTLAAPPDEGERLYEYYLNHMKTQHNVVQSGKFGANMKVELSNDGPVTIILKTQ